jgi:predicted ATPase
VLYLAQSLAEQSSPILLLLTLRSGVETFPDQQSSWVMALKRTGIPLTTLGLAPFTQEETQRFVQALAWAELPEAEHNGASERGSAKGSSATSREQLASFAHWLYVQTRGLPSYLMETLKGLLEQEILVPLLQQDGTWRLELRTELLAQTPASAFLPASVRELIRSQLGQLTSAAWALLVAGAVMGEGLTFERLCQVAQLDEQIGVQALEEVLRCGLLCEGKRAKEAQVFEEYTFAGEMIRAVVNQQAGTTRQRLVQQRLVTLLQAEAESDQGEEASLPHPTPIDEHATGDTRARPQRHVIAGVGSGERSGMRLVTQSAVRGIGTIHWHRQMTRKHADTSICQKPPLGVWERGAAVQAPFAFPRSPP